MLNKYKLSKWVRWKTSRHPDQLPISPKPGLSFHGIPFTLLLKKLTWLSTMNFSKSKLLCLDFKMPSSCPSPPEQRYFPATPHHTPAVCWIEWPLEWQSWTNHEQPNPEPTAGFYLPGRVHRKNTRNCKVLGQSDKNGSCRHPTPEAVAQREWQL